MIPVATLGQQWAQGGMNQVGFAMAIAASTVVFTMVQQFFFTHLTTYVERLMRKMIGSVDPYVQIKFYEDATNLGPKNCQAFTTIETYLSTKCGANAPRLVANSIKDIKAPMLCIDADGDWVTDEFKGVQVQWRLFKEKETTDAYQRTRKKSYFVLTFRKMHREIVVTDYLGHVMEEGKTMVGKNRQLKLYANSSSKGGSDGGYWNYIMNLDHPATLETVAMTEKKKNDIVKDMVRFSQGRDYYKRIGKPWKRGYLLYGPPGSGKSTMIAAMANFLSYDIYDLELTTVSNNSTLKMLLNRVPTNSILVIEDIDCSSKITTKREKPKKKGSNDNFEGYEVEKVTLSGLLNCIDGIYSANEGGRVVVFTTNHLENLDDALVRRGRMDKHIEMPYCGFEAFTVLAKNYLGIQDHELFPKIKKLLQEVEISPADVAENLISDEEVEGSENACLRTLIEAIEKIKEFDEEEGVKENGVCLVENEDDDFEENE